MNPQHFYTFEALGLAPGDSRFDIEKGLIKGVAVIQLGNPKGHDDLTIDTVTLDQFLAAAAAEKGKMQVRLDHRGPGGARTGIKEVVGNLQNFRLDGGTVRADLHLFKKHAAYEQTLEQLVNLSHQLGLSAAFSGDPEEKNGIKHARCKYIDSIDLVTRPASTVNGLFDREGAAGVDTSHHDTMPKNTDQMQGQPPAGETGELTQLRAQIAELTELSQKNAQAINTLLSAKESAPLDDITEEDIPELVEAANAGLLNEEGLKVLARLKEEGVIGEEGEDDGEEGKASSGQGGDGELSRLSRSVIELENKFKAGEQAARDQAVASQFSAVGENIVELSRINETQARYISELEARNQALELAVKQSGGNVPVPEEYEFIGGGDKHPAEVQVELLKKEGCKSPWMELQAKDPALYEDWRKSKQLTR